MPTFIYAKTNQFLFIVFLHKKIYNSTICEKHQTKNNQAEARAEFAERSVQKLQKEVDRLEGMSIRDLLRLLLRI